jgi:serine/threonine-protein kinase RIM15
MEKLLEKLRCRTITAQTGPEAIKYAMSEVKFDIILMEYKLTQINGADVARMVKDTKNANSHTPIVCVTGYLKELPPSHHFDDLMDKPPTVAKLTEVLGKFCQWKAPPPNWTPAQYPVMPFSGLRQESVKSEESPISASSSYGVAIPSSSYRGSSREDSISSSWYGDTEGRTEDVTMTHGKQLPVDWHDHDLVQAFDGLGISRDIPDESELKPTTQVPSRTMIPLRHEESAPPILEHMTVPMKTVSPERFVTRRRSQERMRRESAESGDDEDEELGHLQIRTKSPRNRLRGSSKLGTEMMRTNSRGSVISVEEISTENKIAKSPPSAITEDGKVEDETEKKAVSETETNHGGLTPPEIFPRRPGEHIEDVEMEPAELTTPTSVLGLSEAVSPDLDPTPRPSIACAKLDPQSPSSTS